MRDTSKWDKKLLQAIRRAPEFKENAQLITEVELGLTLLQKVAPDEPATAVSALLSGHRFSVEPLKKVHHTIRKK